MIRIDAAAVELYMEVSRSRDADGFRNRMQIWGGGIVESRGVFCVCLLYRTFVILDEMPE